MRIIEDSYYNHEQWGTVVPRIVTDDTVGFVVSESNAVRTEDRNSFFDSVEPADVQIEAKPSNVSNQSLDPQ